MEYEARDRNWQYMMKALQRDNLDRLFTLMGLVEAIDERERMSGAIEDAHDVSPIFAWQDGQLVDVTEWYKAMVKVWAPSSDGEHAGIDDGLVMPPTDHEPCCYQRDQGCCPFDHPMWEQMCSRKSLGDCPVSASRELPVPPCHRVEEKTCPEEAIRGVLREHGYLSNCIAPDKAVVDDLVKSVEPCGQCADCEIRQDRAYIAPAGLKPQIVGRGGEANDEPVESLEDYCEKIKTLNECRGQHELCEGCEEFLKSQTERDKFLLGVFGPDDPRPTKKMSAQEEEEFRKFETDEEFVRRVFGHYYRPKTSAHKDELPKPTTMRHAWKIICSNCGRKLGTGDRIVVTRTSRGIITGGLYDEDENCVRHSYMHEFCPRGKVYVKDDTVEFNRPVPESVGGLNNIKDRPEHGYDKDCVCAYCEVVRKRSPMGGSRLVYDAT